MEYSFWAISFLLPVRAGKIHRTTGPVLLIKPELQNSPTRSWH